MESGPAVFAGAVFTLFGAALLGWAGVQARLRVPVVPGAGAVAAVGCVLAGVVSMAAGVWCLLHI